MFFFLFWSEYNYTGKKKKKKHSAIVTRYFLVFGRLASLQRCRLVN